VLKEQLCSGCGLCASVSGGAITMGVSPPGYSRPVQNGAVDAAAERRIAAACPGAVVEPWVDEGRTHPFWGPCRQVLTGYASDSSLRFEASSGGALSALAIHALRSGLVDRVIHVSADPDHPTRNRIVVSTSEAEIAANSGSRYSSSSPLQDIEHQLQAGGRFAFIGKPCDVSALRRLARVDPRVDQHAPLALSFFCAGVPSYTAADRILTALGVDPGEVAAFRYRGHGWPGMATATLQNGGSAQMDYAASWGEILSKQVQFRCKICPDGVGGVADIACGDAWYGDEDGYPKFEESEGRSLIVSRTAVGERLVDAALAAGALVASPLEIDQIDLMQPGQTRKKRLVKSRVLALAATLHAAPRMDGTWVDQAAKGAEMGEQLRSFVGAARRIMTGRR
jgi:coenzyme F420 hydrogenase subunit beta